MQASIGWPADWGGGLANFGQGIIEMLLRGDSDGNVYPWLAESYEVADDLKSITFKLRKGVKFHDGTELDAAAAKWNLENQMEAKRAPNWTSVDIIDDYTIRVNLSTWRNILLNEFSDNEMALGAMVSPTAFGKNGIDWMRQNAVGTGPFKFISFRPEEGTITEKNTDYWQEGKPYLDALEVRVIMDSVTRKAYMEAQDGDLMQTYGGKPAADCAAMGMTVELLNNGIFALIPDTANPDSPWANQKVREAAEYAIDREAIAEGLGYGYWEAPYQVPARDNPAYNPDFTLARKYDPERAKQLLEDAGYGDGFDTSIICFVGGLNRDAAVAVQGYLMNVGIRAEVDFPEIAKYMSYNFGGWNNAVLLGPIIWTGNFNAALSSFHPDYPNFASWLRTPEFTDAINASLASPTPDVELMRAVTDIMTKDASIIPVCEQSVGNAYWPYVMDIGSGERGAFAFLNYDAAWLNK